MAPNLIHGNLDLPWPCTALIYSVPPSLSLSSSPAFLINTTIRPTPYHIFKHTQEVFLWTSGKADPICISVLKAVWPNALVARSAEVVQ